MNRLLFPVILLLSLSSHSAFATHAYRSENCKSTTHQLNYKGNYPIGGMYGISLIGQEDNDTTALPLLDSETPNTLEDANVIFTETYSKVTEQGPSSNDCDFDHEEWKSEKVVEINLISTDASNTLGLKQCDKMTFICEESTDYPNGNHECN